MNLRSIYHILVHLVLLVRVNVVLSHRKLKTRGPQPTIASANENNSNNSMGGGKTVATNEYREPKYESSDPREIPPKKPPKRRPLTSIHEPYFRFNHIDPTERRHTTQRRHLSHPAEARDTQRQPGKNLIVLDIDKRHDVYGYQISYERNKVIFRANPSYLFRQVKKGNDIGWYSKNDGEYPYKVVYTCNRGEDEIKVFFPKPEGFDEQENVEVVRADRPVYDKSKDPKYMYAQGTPETSVPLPHEHTQPEVNIHQPDFTQIPMGSEYTQPQIQPVYNHVQMPDPFSQIPMTPEHTPSHMDPALTHIPMSPEQIHSKVPGGTRSFEPTEAHGSHTHGTDPRFNRRHTHRPDQHFEHQMTPEFSKIPMTPEHTPSHMDPELTHIPMSPEQIHSKVPGGTRSFEPTEAHGSHTHGTDPRFNRRHTHRPDQHFEHQMTPEFSKIPMSPEHTPSHMDPALTHIPMSPEQIHSKVPGGTRSFEPTEAHGSHTHGTDPRFNRRHTHRPDQHFEHQMTPEFSKIPMSPEHTPSHMDPEITHIPMSPEQIHSKVPGGTRSFEPTEAHGSHTHGTDPRFNRRHTHRPDQNVEQEVQSKITDPIARLRERHRQIEETERLSDLSVIDSRPSGISGLPTSPYPEPSMPPSSPMAQPDLSTAATHFLPTPASLTPSHPVQNPEPAPTPTPAGKLAPKSHEPTVAPAQVPESDSSSFQLSPKRLRKPVGESEGILYMTLQVPPQPGVVPCEPSPLHQVSPMKVPEGHIPEDVGPVSFSYPAPSDTSVFDSSYSHSKVMVDASTSTINYVDASTQFPERSVPVQVSSLATCEKSTSTHDLETFQHSLAESVARSPSSKDPTRRDEFLFESTPADEPIREPPVPEPPRRQEPITSVLPNDDEVAVEHIFEDAEVDYSRVLQVGADEEPEVPPSRPSKTRVQTIRRHNVREEPRQETVRQEVVSEHTSRDSPECDDIFSAPRPREPPEVDDIFSVPRPSESPEVDDIFSAPRPRDFPERVSGPRESPESQESVREQRTSESSARHAPRSQETRSEPTPSVSPSRDAPEPNQPETTRESDARPSSSGERIRRTTTSAGDRINITQSENEIRINTADPENGTYSIGIDPKQHDKVVLTFANNSTVFVLDGASHTLGLNQGGEPRDIISDRLTMQRAQPQPVGGLIGGPTPVYTDVPPVTKFATPQQRDPETVPSDSSVPDSGPSDQGAPGADPSEQRRGKFTIPDEALGQLPPPPYSGFQAPSYLPDSQVIPDQRSLDRVLRLLEVSTMANLAQMSRPAPYVPTTNVNVTHNPHDPSDTAGSNDSDSEEIGSGSPEPSTSSAVDPSSSPLAEGEPSTEDQAEAISIDQGGSSEDQSAIPRPRSDGDVSGRGSTPILIPLEDDDNESGTEFSLDINATDNDENITETKKDASTNESTYKFKSTTRCTEVRINTVTIWKKGEQSINKPRDVKVNEAKDEVTICNGTKGVVYKLDNGTWRYDSTVTYTDGGSDQSKHGSEVQLDSATKKPVELNIKKKDSTDEFKYVKMNKTGTYTANEGYGFNRVVAKGPTCCSATKNIWDARVKNEYGNKVVVDGIGDKKKTLTIHFDEDKLLTFSKDTKEWLEQTAAQNEMDAVTATVDDVTFGQGVAKTGVLSELSSLNQTVTNPTEILSY